MNNPFDKKWNDSQGRLSGTFAEFILNQIKDINVEESKMIERNGKDIIVGRSTVRNEAIKLGFKFITKSDSDGNLWVYRVK